MTVTRWLPLHNQRAISYSYDRNYRPGRELVHLPARNEMLTTILLKLAGSGTREEDH